MRFRCIQRNGSERRSGGSRKTQASSYFTLLRFLLRMGLHPEAPFRRSDERWLCLNGYTARRAAV